MQKTYNMQITIASIQEYEPLAEEIIRFIEKAVRKEAESLEALDLAYGTVVKVWPESLEDVTQENEKLIIQQENSHE